MVHQNRDFSRFRLVWSASAYLLVLASPAYGHGGISALAGLQDLLLILIGLLGLPVAVVLGVAVRAARKGKLVTLWAAVARIFGILYILLAMFFCLALQDNAFVAFPSVLAALVLVLLCFLFLYRPSRS